MGTYRMLDGLGEAVWTGELSSDQLALDDAGTRGAARVQVWVQVGDGGHWSSVFRYRPPTA